MRIAVVLGIAVTITAAGCGKKIDRDKAEKGVKDMLTTYKVVVKSVTCPADRPAKKGDKFSCDVETDHQKVKINIEQMDDDGSVSIKAPGRIVNEKELGDSLEATAGGGIDIVCGDKVSVVQVGETIHCETKHPDGSIDITLKDEAGHFDLKQNNAGGGAEPAKEPAGGAEPAKEPEPPADHKE